jgi:PilZ domain
VPTEKRRSARSVVGRRVQVAYTDDQGRERYEIVPVRDLSPSGCRLILAFRCQPRTILSLSLSPVARGSATVRYQNPSPRGFVTGLEFLGGLTIPPSILAD